VARKSDTRPAPPIVLYAPLGELKVYEISEAELERLAAGPPGQLQLNFALALLPTALSIGVTLLTTTMSSAISVSFQIAFWVMLVQGIYALIQWMRSNRSQGKLVKEIRLRMPDRRLNAEQIVTPEIGNPVNPGQSEGG